MATTAHLGGIPLILTGGASWSMTSGISAQEAEFEIAAGDEGAALALREQRNAVTLELAGNTFAALSVLRVSPSSIAAKRRVTVVDRRYWWDRKVYERSVNKPRRVGAFRRGGVGWNVLQKVPGLDTFAAKLTHYAHSLDNAGVLWEAETLLRDILKEMDPGAGALVIAESSDLAFLPLQGLELSGSCADAFQQALNRMGGIEVTINALGQVVLYSWLTRTEMGVLGPGDSSRNYGAVGPGVYGAGTVEVVDMAAEAPEYVDVLFTPEIEVRFDFTADPTAEPDETTTAIPGAVPMVVQNVVVNPVPTLRLVAGNDEKTLTCGDYIEITQFLTALAITSASGGSVGGSGLLDAGLTMANIRRAVLPRNSAILHRSLGTLEKLVPGNLAINWSEVVSAIFEGFRSLWRLPEQWTDNCLAIRDYLVGTWNVQGGQRARAVCYADHTIFPNAQGRWAAGKTAETMPWCIEVSTGYPGLNTDPAATTPVAPFAVSVVDEDQGIIGTRQAVNNVLESKALIGLMTNLPTGAIRKSNTGAVFINSPANGQVGTSLPSISTNMRMCIILTMVPARALFRVRVHPGEVGITYPCSGPPQEIRVHDETARIGWSQLRAGFIQNAFGLGGDRAAGRAGQQVALDALRDLRACVNLTGETQGAASLTQIAQGYAKDIYARYAPRLMGSRVADSRGAAGQVIPGGGIVSVSHSVDSRGAAQTSIMLRAMRPMIGLLNLLPSGTRAILLKLIPTKGGK